MQVHIDYIISKFKRLPKNVTNPKESDIIIADINKCIVEFDTRIQKGTTGKEERRFRLEGLHKYNKTSSSGGTDNSITHFSDELVKRKVRALAPQLTLIIV